MNKPTSKSFKGFLVGFYMKENRMNIHIGSNNPVKIQAVVTVFTNASCSSINAKSQVSSQPRTDVETRTGAVNRALECAIDGAYGIGLEGGVMLIESELYMCNWGALVTPDHTIYTEAGARIPLPLEIKDRLEMPGEEHG